MTSDVLALYQQVILDHHKNPRNRRRLDDGSQADGDNPVCGDRITVYVRLAGAVVSEATFEGLGCAICIASASLMTVAVRGRTLPEIDELCRRVDVLVTAPPGALVDDLGPLSALAGVRRFPTRAKCALLPWHTLTAAVHRQRDTVSTE